jgi:hypothetical protein
MGNHEHVDPRTPQEWQEAVNLAELYLILNSAEVFGLVTEGPRVNVERCEDLIKMGRERGYIPAGDLAECSLAVAGAAK